MSEGPPTSGSGAEPGAQQPEQPAVPAGWYPHPNAPGWEAYWTGSGWGAETRPAQAPAPAVPAAMQQQPVAEEQPVAQEQPVAEEQQYAAAQPAVPAAAHQQTAATPSPGGDAVTAVAATPVQARPPAARSDSALPVILCVLGALVAVVGAFLPEASLDFNGNAIDLTDNTMVAAGYGIAVIAAAVLGAAIAAWAYVKSTRTWIPILLGVVVVAVAVYAGTAGLDVTPDFAPKGLSLDDQGSPSTGIFAVGIGGLLMILGGIGLARENR